MAKQILNIVETAYRATLEEQDDPVLWITTALKGAGSDNAVVLRGNAVNYLVKSQEVGKLVFGTKAQTQPPRLAEDIARLIDKDVTVYVVEEDAAERGLEPSDLIGGYKSISRQKLAGLFADYDQVWHW